jgi:hypothetical protein
MSMSTKEYSTILKEMGVTNSGSGGVDGESFRVEHILVLSITEKWERALDKWVHLTLDLSREMMVSMRLVATAASIAMVLWGTSKLITSLRANNSSNNGDGANDDDGGGDKK